MLSQHGEVSSVLNWLVESMPSSGVLKWFGYIYTVLTVDELLSQSEYDLFVKTSIPGHSLHHLLPPYRIVVVTYMNVDIHSTCLIMTLSCLKILLLCALYTNLSHLTTNLFYVLFCVFPMCYNVRLSHLNKYFLLTYNCTTLCQRFWYWKNRICLWIFGFDFIMNLM